MFFSPLYYLALFNAFLYILHLLLHFIIIIIINGNASSETVNDIYGKQPTSYLQVTAS